jgi:hypothetical protein
LPFCFEVDEEMRGTRYFEGLGNAPFLICLSFFVELPDLLRGQKARQRAFFDLPLPQMF